MQAWLSSWKLQKELEQRIDQLADSDDTAYLTKKGEELKKLMQEPDIWKKVLARATKLHAHLPDTPLPQVLHILHTHNLKSGLDSSNFIPLFKKARVKILRFPSHFLDFNASRQASIHSTAQIG